jgi:hypothetical protein
VSVGVARSDGRPVAPIAPCSPAATQLRSRVFGLFDRRSANFISTYFFACRTRVQNLPQYWVDRMQKYQPAPAIGSRVRLSALGMERCPKFKNPTRGIIVGVNLIGTSFRILLDGRKLPVTLHVSYIELDDERKPSCAAEPQHLAPSLSEEART